MLRDHNGGFSQGVYYLMRKYQNYSMFIDEELFLIRQLNFP